MKALGALLILWGGAGCYLLRRRTALLPIRVGEALLGDLAVLRLQVCVYRRSLPAILMGELVSEPGTAFLWRPILATLRDDEACLSQCWSQAAGALPEPLGRILAPLGPLLPAGGERLAEAIDETREELTEYLRTERGRQEQENRLTAGVCLAGACLLILVLI